MKRSRIEKKYQQKLMTRTIIFVTGTIILVFLLLKFGINLLVNLSLYLQSKRGAKSDITETELMPFAPQLDSLPQATNSSQIVISGYANPGSKVKIFLNGNDEKETVANIEGRFETKIDVLILGLNTIFAQATDIHGKRSSESEPQKIYYRNKPPELEILSPEDNTEFKGEDEEKKKIIISGKTEPNVNVFINDYQIIVQSGGNFEYETTLKEGENTYKIKVVDDAGNLSIKELKFTYQP